MSLLKYRGETDGGNVHWLQRSELDGAPYRGSQVPMMRDEEFDHYAQRVKDAKVRVFKLWEPKDLAEYQNVLDHCANSWWTLLRDVEQFIPAKENYLVLCSWLENFIEVAPEHVDAARTYTRH